MMKKRNVIKTDKGVKFEFTEISDDEVKDLANKYGAKYEEIKHLKFIDEGVLWYLAFANRGWCN